jgi:hypothetical protein
MMMMTRVVSGIVSVVIVGSSSLPMVQFVVDVVATASVDASLVVVEVVSPREIFQSKATSKGYVQNLDTVLPKTETSNE